VGVHNTTARHLGVYQGYENTGPSPMSYLFTIAMDSWPVYVPRMWGTLCAADFCRRVGVVMGKRFHLGTRDGERFTWRRPGALDIYLSESFDCEMMRPRWLMFNLFLSIFGMITIRLFLPIWKATPPGLEA